MSAAARGLRGLALPRLLADFATELPGTIVTGLEMDSRRVRPGDLFLACQGRGQHGMAHLQEAISRGAAAVAWEPAAGVAAPTDLPAVAVPNLARLAGVVAARFYGEPSRDLFMVGITGTDGKTSTAHLVAQALDHLGQACAYLGTLGYGRLAALQSASHTTPDPVQLQRLLGELRDAGVKAAALEVSSHALDQWRVNGVRFDIAVLTNIGRDHLDYHGDLAHYAGAKHKLFKWPGLKAAVLNRDDAYGRAWSHECHGERDCVGYGLEGPAPGGGRFLLGEKLELRPEGLSMHVRSSWGSGVLRTRLLGRFNAYNLLAALAVLLERNIPLAEACTALGAAATVPGRIEAFRGSADRPLVVVDYAHTPQALEQVLHALRAHCRGRLWAVFGCGGDRDPGKRPLMGAAAARGADELIITDDNPRREAPEAIVAEIRQGITAGPRLRVIHDRAQAIATAVAEAAAQDVVLVAGKGHEDYQIYGQEVRPFSDRAYVAQLLGVAQP